MDGGENRTEHKDDWQSTVLATAVSVLILVVVFLCPWRVESTGELKWSPIYQEPLSYVRSYNDRGGTKGSSRIIANEADIAYDILALEVLIVAVAGGLLYIFSSGSGEEELQ